MTAKSYIKVILHQGHQSTLVKFRLGVAQIKIKTGWYENVRGE